MDASRPDFTRLREAVQSDPARRERLRQLLEETAPDLDDRLAAFAAEMGVTLSREAPLSDELSPAELASVTGGVAGSFIQRRTESNAVSPLRQAFLDAFYAPPGPG